MKCFFILASLIFISLFLFVVDTLAYVRVKPYFRRNGTYVQPHFRSNPNSFKYDNWSFRGNVNPFSGRRGYRW
jgi:hypothetical protein